MEKERLEWVSAGTGFWFVLSGTEQQYRNYNKLYEEFGKEIYPRFVSRENVLEFADKCGISVRDDTSDEEKALEEMVRRKSNVFLKILLNKWA